MLPGEQLIAREMGGMHRLEKYKSLHKKSVHTYFIGIFLISFQVTCDEMKITSVYLESTAVYQTKTNFTRWS